ncbi:MAG: DNA-packaging protein [Methylobacteriaceae bacterium]|nr:DNA-packaging protein [Methylobacteriaceae bacterium]
MAHGTSTICAPKSRDALIAWRRANPAEDILAGLGQAAHELFLDDFLNWGRDDQLPPDAAQGGGDWSIWLALGGRGAGKTRAGAEWVKGMALGRRPWANAPVGRIALIGETAADLREVMIEGVSGILAVHRACERPVWEPTRRRLSWPNGAIAQGFSAEDPESLRGPQFSAAWCDELAKWRRPEAVFDMLQFGLRLGDRPRQMITTTPRPIALIKNLIADPRVAVTRAATRLNAPNLAPDFLESIVGRYAGARLGRQELDGEIVDETPGALWTRAMIEAARCDSAPALKRIVVAVDPPASSSARADACGIVAAGVSEDERIYVLADATLERARPDEWAQAAIALWRKLEADALVAEVNQGGEMVTSVIAAADPSVPVQCVRATRGKYLRAAPVAQLWEQGRARHVGAFPALEDEMCAFGPDGLGAGKSPDRLDALVWAVTALTQTAKKREPRMRRV